MALADDKSMTTQITFFTVNGRKFYPEHLTNFRQITKSTWTVYRGDTKYTIEGGRHAGGRRGEWFVDFGRGGKPVQCTSLMDALRMLDTM